MGTNPVIIVKGVIIFVIIIHHTALNTHLLGKYLIG